MALVIFIVLSVLCAGAVAAMIVSRNQAHNALFLVLAFSSLGGIFGLLDAPFAAVVQVLVYAGAIMVLFLFAIMMFDLRQPAPPERKRLRAVLGTGLALILFAQLILAGRRALAGGGGAAASGRRYRPPRQAPLLRLSLCLRDHVPPHPGGPRRRPGLGRKEGGRMIPPAAFLVLAALLFVLGIIAFFVKKDLLTQFMAVEVMLNAGNLAFLALAKALGKADGQIVVLFIITVAAAEAVIGLAIIVLIFRQRKSIRTDDLKDLKG